MAPERQVSRTVARRFLAIRHFLAPPRSLPSGPASVMRVIDRLGSLQFDPIDVAGRNHDLVLLARVAGYRREMTDRLLYEDRLLFETYNKGLSIVPTAQLPYYRLNWERWQASERNSLEDHAALVEELLDRIRSNGPMSATDVEPRAAIEWFWRPTNQVRAVLEALALSGTLGLARRDGNRRVYDLVERLFPPEVLRDRRPADEAWRHKLLSRYRAHGLLGAGGQAEVWMGTGPTAVDRAAQRRQLLEDGVITAVSIDGTKGDRYVVTEELPMLDQAEREVSAGRPPGNRPPGVAFLAPLDPLVWDRRLLPPLFRFDYLWEVYVPAAKRRWGYYVLPIWFGDRLIGRIEPRIDRKAGVLRVVGLWWDDGFDPLVETGFVDAFAEALEAHRAFGSAKAVRLPRLARHRAFVAAVRSALEERRFVRDRAGVGPVSAA